MFGAGALLAWRFRRSRVVAALIGLAVLERLVHPSAEELAAGSSWTMTGTLLLIVIGALVVMKDRGVLSTRGALQPAAVIGGLVGGLALWSLWPGALAWSWAPLLPAGMTGWWGGSDGALIAGGASLAVSVGFAIRRDHPLEKGFVWSLVVLLMALHAGADPVASGVYLMIAGLILSLAVVETSYSMAFRDELTGLPARRALWQEIDAAGRSYAVAMVDVDHFKKFNDRHGHDVGDQVLKMVAGRLAKVTGGGRSFRYGGEEFTVVFPGKGRAQVLPHLEELRRDIEDSRFSVRRFGRPRKKPPVEKARKSPPRQLSVTVSIGVAERTEKAATPEAVVKAADRALYRAKKAGRNRVK